MPLSAFTRMESHSAPLSLNRQGQFPAATISFNLAPDASLGDAVKEIERARRELKMPDSVVGSFQGTAAAFQNSLTNVPLLILAALVTVYIVLGVLYESYIHPITILSTLPSAGVGALLALLLFGQEMDVIALIGIILLIGIVKKNGIMMIDFALDAERKEGKAPADAIYQACLLRFRPIMMTTMAALFAGLPLALGGGSGSELRRPLGIAIVGGLTVQSGSHAVHHTRHLPRIRSPGERVSEEGTPADADRAATRRRHEYFVAIYPSAGCDDVVDDSRRVRRCPCVSWFCLFQPCPKSSFRQFRFRQPCPVRARKRWHRRSLHRWSDSLRESPA